MTVVLDLPPEMERKMQEVAQAEGLDVPALVRETMAARLPFPVAPASMTDRQLLEEINRGFSEEF